MIVAVFSMPGRDALTARTVAMLDGPGGASGVPCPKILWWVGRSAPPSLPPGWIARWLQRPPAGSVADFFALVREARDVGGGDLHVFEDDVIPCRNVVPYLARRTWRYLTSHFNPRGRHVGEAFQLWRVNGFDCSQALTIPARLVARFAELQAADLDDTPDPPAKLAKGQDLMIDRWLRRWREPMVWGPTLVQHQHGQRANGLTRVHPLEDGKFPGEAFDALALVDDPDPMEDPPPPPAPLLRPRVGGRCGRPRRP